MGNGAAITSRRPTLILGGFSSVESLINNGYFNENLEAYKAAVKENIKNEALDILEILIPAGEEMLKARFPPIIVIMIHTLYILCEGNCRKVLPLHIAAEYGSLDCCELLLSGEQRQFTINA
jgi:hypothetical protein